MDDGALVKARAKVIPDLLPPNDISPVPTRNRLRQPKEREREEGKGWTKEKGEKWGSVSKAREKEGDGNKQPSKQAN